MLWYGDNILSVTVVTLSMKEMIDKLHFFKNTHTKIVQQKTLTRDWKIIHRLERNNLKMVNLIKGDDPRCTKNWE